MRSLTTCLLLLALLAGCGQKETDEPAAEAPASGSTPATEATEAAAPDRVTLTAAERQAGGVRLGTLTQRPMSGGLKVNGTLDVPPENLASVSAPLGGLPGSGAGTLAANATPLTLGNGSTLTLSSAA